jgi:hypothetical protein
VAREFGEERGECRRQGRFREVSGCHAQGMADRAEDHVLGGIGAVRQPERTGAAKTQHPLFPFTRTGLRRLVSSRIVGKPATPRLADTNRKQI